MQSRRCCFGMILLVLVGLTSAFGQVAVRVTQQVNPQQRSRVSGTVPRQVYSATDAGRADSAMTLGDILVRLQPSSEQEATLTALIADVHNPKSPNFHQWLTPDQFGSQFGVADADLQAVKAWLTAAGLQVVEVSKGRQWLRVSGTVGQAEAAFGTQVHQYRVSGTTEFSISDEISIPSAVAPVVAGVVSLSSFRSSPQHSQPRNVSLGSDHRLHVQSEKVTTPGFTNPGSPETNSLAPGDFARIYNTLPLLKQGVTGTGLSIGILGRSDIYMSDIESFRKVFGLPLNDPQIIQPNGDPGVLAGDDVESSLDLEWAGAVAPNATIKFVSGNSSYSTDGIDIAAAYAVDNRVAPILSLSYGSCEQGEPMSEIQFYNQTWAQAAAEGITVFVSAGDAGSSGCTDPSGRPYATVGLGVNALASTNFNVAVGGTELLDTNLDTYWNLNERKDQSSVRGYIPEAAWNESCNLNLPISLGNCYFQDQEYAGSYAGGGGASNCAVHDSAPNFLTGLYTCTSGWPKPEWQQGNGVPNDGERDLPDVSLTAAGHDGYLICIQGSCQYSANSDGSFTLESASVVGGTSASAPSMAGILALAEQRVGAYQGQANYKLYELFATQKSPLDCSSSDETDPIAATSCIFHDVTVGTNALSCSLSGPDCVASSSSSSFGILAGYSAGHGYDETTGLGSIDATNLIAGWTRLATINTTTSVSVNPTKFAHGTYVDLTSTVAPTKGSGAPTGEVVYLISGAVGKDVPVLTSQLMNGIYAGHIDTLPGGTYTLKARYGGDGTYVSSTSDQVSLIVAPEKSKLTATTYAPSARNTLGFPPIVEASETSLGTNFYVQVDVSGLSGHGKATGTVTLENGLTKLGTYPVDQTGIIYVPCGPNTSCDLALGSYTLKAAYSGDSSFDPSTTTFPFTITKRPLDYVEVLSNLTPPADSTVIATISFEYYDPIALPTGTVRLTRSDTGATLATGSVNKSGQAVIPFIAPAGSYGVVPMYSGDANYSPGNDLSYYSISTITAGSSPTTTTMAVNSTTTAVGGSTNVSITVTPNQATNQFPTGSVYLTLVDGAITNTYPLVHGAVTLNLPWPSAGNYKFEATYSGDTHFAASLSRFIAVTVAKGNVNISVVPQTLQEKKGKQTSLTAYLKLSVPVTTVTPPSGTVQFYDSVNGSVPTAIGIPANVTAGNGVNTILATTSLSLPIGENRITAVYSGDANWQKSEGGPIQILVH